MSHKNNNVFDELAPNYDEVLNNDLKNFSSFKRDYFIEYKIQTIKKFLDYSPSIILDFGCGDGAEALCLKKAFPSSKIIGVDVSQKCISIATSKNLKDCSFMVYDGGKLPFEDNSIDFVFSACVFHHIEKGQHLNLIKELYRVLKYKSKLIVFEHNPINPITKMIFKKTPIDKDAEMVSTCELNSNIKSAGFNFTKITYALFFPRYKFFKPFFGLEKFMTSCPLGAQYFISACKASSNSQQ